MSNRTLAATFLATFIFSAAILPGQQLPSNVSIDILTTFDYPGEGNSTEPQKINDRGDVAGIFIDSAGANRGFIRFRDGNFSSPIIEPNDTANFTQARDINDSRLVCGYYEDGTDATFHGFFLSEGTFTEFDIPDAINTFVVALNNAGNFAGGFDTSTGPRQGFESIGGSIVPFSIPGATSTIAFGLNNFDQIVGRYADSGLIDHCFFRDADGTLTFPIDPPGSTGTFPFGINDQEVIVGRFDDGSGIGHAFVFRMPDKFLVYDFPGAILTSFNGINRFGVICGRYEDSGGIGHGIIARIRHG